MVTVRRRDYPDPDLVPGVVYRRIGASGLADGSRRAVPFATAAFALRGVYLLAVIPVTAVLWLLLAPVRLLHRRPHPPSLVQWMAWSDELVLAGLERTVLFPFGVRAGWPRPPEHRAQARMPNPFQMW